MYYSIYCNILTQYIILYIFKSTVKPFNIVISHILYVKSIFTPWRITLTWIY